MNLSGLEQKQNILTNTNIAVQINYHSININAEKDTKQCHTHLKNTPIVSFITKCIPNHAIFWFSIYTVYICGFANHSISYRKENSYTCFLKK